MMRAFIKPGLGVVFVFAVLIVLAFLSAISFPTLCDDEGGAQPLSKEGNHTSSVFPRKLLRRALAMEEPDRIWGEKCTKADIVINQGPSPPLPSGIPTYTVEIMNVCATGCDISGIHLRCGWFSSARLVNPKIFKRIRFNDCLVNDGKPLVNGDILSFEYANTFLYPLSVSAVACP